MKGKIRNPKSEIRKYKRILIVRLDRIGDVILSTPVIRAVRDAYPDSHIACMVRPYALDIVRGNPCLDEVIVYDKDAAHKSFWKTVRFAADLRKKKFDLAILLHPTNRTHLIAFLAGIPVRVGYDKKLSALLTKRIPHTKQLGLKHEVDYALDMLRCVGIEPRDRKLCIPVHEESERKVKAVFASNGIRESDTVIAVHPGASCPSKRWSAERFARVADRLTEGYNAKVVIIASEKDRAFGDKVASLMKGPSLNLSGKTSVADLASVLRRAKLFISNDSGPVHIACAVGTPVVDIFGRNDRGLSPRRWGPTGANDVVIHKEVGCEVCLAHNCKLGFKCLDAITVDEVVEAGERILRVPGTGYRGPGSK